MPASGDLTLWKGGDKPSAEHLNQAWKRLIQIGAIDGLTQIGHGTALASNPTFTYAGQFDAKVKINSDESSNRCYYHKDYPDPRYLVHQVTNEQRPNTPQEGETRTQDDDPMHIVEAGLPGSPPGQEVMAWNLWENEWNSHYILPDEIVTVHCIRTTLSDQPTAFVTWYVFNKAPKPIRKCTVVTQDINTITNCDTVIQVWDNKEMGKDASCREITLVTLSQEALVGAWDIDELDQLDYIPTKPSVAPTAYIPDIGPGVFWNGDIVAWYPVQHVGLTGCKDQVLFDQSPVNTLQFFDNDFELTQNDVHGTGCYDATIVKWKGMDVTSPYAGIESPAVNCCEVKGISFDKNTEVGLPSTDTSYAIQFGVECLSIERHCGCPDGGTETINEALVTGKVRLPTVERCVVWCVEQDPETLIVTAKYGKGIFLGWVDGCDPCISYAPPCEKTVYPLSPCPPTGGPTIYTQTDESANVGKVLQIGSTCYNVEAATSVSCSTDAGSVSGTVKDDCDECLYENLTEVQLCPDGAVYYTEQDLSLYDFFTDGTDCWKVNGLVPNTGQAKTVFAILYAFLSCWECNNPDSSSM